MNDTKENKTNIIVTKTYFFALEIVKLFRSLQQEKQEYVLSKQILRSGTSIGANVNEAQSAESKSDFIHKMGISAKECRETIYWLNILKDSDYIYKSAYDKFINEANEILKILNSIILSAKKNKN